MVKISGVKLSMSRVRHYAKLWRCSTKKSSPVPINRDTLETVEKWRKSITHKVAWYIKLGYAIATQDESNFKGIVLSTKY